MATRTVRAVFEATSSALENGLRRSADAANRTADAMSRVGQETAKLSGSGQSASSTLDRMARSAEANERAWTTAGTALATFGAVTATGLGLSAKAAVDWESSFAGVKKTVDDSAEGYAHLSAELRGMARELPASHAEIAGVAEAAGQLGVAREDITAFTATMVDLSETTNLTADEAATSIAQMTNVMQTAPEDVERLGSALVALGNDGASTERQIIQMAQRMSGAAATVGLAEHEVLALADTVASMGIEVEAGGTAVSRILVDMSKASQTGSEELSIFAQVAGVSAQEFATAFREDPAEAFAQFIAGLGDMQAAGQDVFTTLDDLGLADVRVSQALLGMASSGDLLTDSLELGARAWEENTALADEAAQRYETTAARLEVMRNNAVDAGISLGSVFLPVLAEGADRAADLAGWLADLPEPLQQITAWGGASAATLGLVAGGFLLVAPRAFETYRAFQQLGIVGPRTSAAIRGVAGVLTGPWGFAIAGAVAAAGAFIVSQAEKRAAIEEVRSTLDEETGAITDNTRAWAGKTLQDAGALDAGRSLGIARGDLTAALLGEEDALRRVNAAVEPHIGNLDVMTVQGNTLTASQIDLAKAAGLVSDVIGESSGHLIDAQEKSAELRAEVESTSASLPQMAEGLARTAIAAADYAREQAAVNEAVTGGFVPAMERAEAAGDEAAEAYAEWVREVAAGSDAFVTASGALSEVNEATQEWAQAQADATDTAEDSWEDYWDGQSVSVDKWLTQLEEMVEAQAEWETNMLLLSGRVSQGVIDELQRLGPEGAPLVAELVDASDDELARLEAVFGDRARGGTTAYASAMADAGPVIRAAAARWGEGIAAEIAAELESGEATVAEVVAAYDLAATIDMQADPAHFNTALAAGLALGDASVTTPSLALDNFLFSATLGESLGMADDSTGTPDLDADPRRAAAELSAWLGLADRSVGTPDIDADPRKGDAQRRAFIDRVTSANPLMRMYLNADAAHEKMRMFFQAYQGTRVGVNIGFSNENGGLHDRGTRYADGGIDAAGRHVPRVPMMGGPQYGKRFITWGEDVTGWEAYISGKPGMEERNRAILAEAAHRLGMTVLDNLGTPTVRHFADGGMWSQIDLDVTERERFDEAMHGAQQDWMASLAGRRGSPSRMPWQMIWALTKSVAPEARMTSNYRPGASTAGYGNTSLHALGRAIDVVSSNMASTFMKILTRMPWPNELIHTPMGGMQINRGGVQTGNFPLITRLQHYDHIHLGYEDGGLIEAMMRRPKQADTGHLTLERGWNPPTYNGLGRREHLVDVQRYAPAPAAPTTATLDPAPVAQAVATAVAQLVPAALGRLEVVTNIGGKEFRGMVREATGAGARRGGG